MKTPAHIKIAAAAVLLIVAAQARLDAGPQSWKSGATTVTLAGGTLTVSGEGAMGDYSNFDVPPWSSAASSITGLTIGDGVTHIGDYALSNCANLTSVTIPNGVTAIGRYAFKDCAGLMSVTIPGSVMSIGNIGNFTGFMFTVFSGCAGLASITVAADNARYSSEDGILFNKDKTALIKYPPGRQGDSYTIQRSVTAIETSAFFGCTGLTSVTVPRSVKTIGWRVFADCTRLTSVTIEDGVRSIGSGMFERCAGLTSVTIPRSVEHIGEFAFWACTGLVSVISLRPVPPNVGKETFYHNNIPDICLYVPKGSIDAYRAANGWKNFKCIKPLASAPKGE